MKRDLNFWNCTNTKSDYNYFRIKGWVVILKNNEPVNYHADHGDIDEDYYVVDEIFKTMCSELKDNLDVVDILVECLEMKISIWNNHKLNI
jgi:hypothetical protein